MTDDNRTSCSYTIDHWIKLLWHTKLWSEFYNHYCSISNITMQSFNNEATISNYVIFLICDYIKQSSFCSTYIQSIKIHEIWITGKSMIQVNKMMQKCKLPDSLLFVRWEVIYSAPYISSNHAIYKSLFSVVLIFNFHPSSHVIFPWPWLL